MTPIASVTEAPVTIETGGGAAFQPPCAAMI
jgi:hypothetical protein